MSSSTFLYSCNSENRKKKYLVGPILLKPLFVINDYCLNGKVYFNNKVESFDFQHVFLHVKFSSWFIKDDFTKFLQKVYPPTAEWGCGRAYKCGIYIQAGLKTFLYEQIRNTLGEMSAHNPNNLKMI